VNVASGTGIVYSGGGQTRAVTLQDQLNGMRESSSSAASASSTNTSTMANRGKSGADFIFDVGFLTANPQVSLFFFSMSSCPLLRTLTLLSDTTICIGSF
jgi:hypothetical protein